MEYIKQKNTRIVQEIKFGIQEEATQQQNIFTPEEDIR